MDKFNERRERAYYDLRIDENNKILSVVKKKLRVIPFLKILFFLIALACVVVLVRTGCGNRLLCYSILILSAIFFFLLYKTDERYLQKKAYHEALRTVYEDEISFLEGNVSRFDGGERFVDKNHPYTYDLDVFGEKSLFQMINRTATYEAATFLAERLSRIPAHETEIIERQQALAELAAKDDFRHKFMALCQGFDGKKNEYDRIRSFTKDNPFLTSRAGKVLIWVSITATLVFAIMAGLGYLPWSIFITLFMIQFFFPMLFAGELNKIGADIGFLHKSTLIHAKLLYLVSQENFTTSINRAVEEKLFGAIDSRAALKELAILLRKFDQRHNAYILILLNGLFLRDLFLLRAFYRWKSRYVASLAKWMDALAEMEADISMASFMFNMPGFVRPEIKDWEEWLLDARDLGHPFIPWEKRVDNDITIQKKEFLIITGANMAGKSTFLRTVGINYLMAVNGMNVCAARFDFSLFQLFSSMRNTDDLSSGTSYFKAELERIRSLIRFCRTHKHTLIILDELLKGTNSRDKLNGSILFLKEMAKLPVTGIIATHDLELAKLENEQSELFRNLCFEISLSEGEKYSYKIQAGVSKNLNATYLLEKILKEEL